MKTVWIGAVLGLLLLPTLPVLGTEGASGEIDAEATLEDLAWIAGAWRGTCFGGECEEIWGQPFAGTMVGSFKLVQEGQPAFYELMLITREEDGWVLKVKHFNPDFSAWEEKADAVVFRLEKVEPGRIQFKGLTFSRRGEEGLHITLRMRRGDQVSDEVLRLERLAP